jgi:hypothetical protein
MWDIDDITLLRTLIFTEFRLKHTTANMVELQLIWLSKFKGQISLKDHGDKVIHDRYWLK